MSEDEDKGPSIPEGTYRARALCETVLWDTDRNGDPYCDIMMRIVDEDFPSVSGKALPWRAKFANPKNEEFARKGFAAAGWDGKSPIWVDPSTDDVGLVGLGLTVCSIVVVHRMNSEWTDREGVFHPEQLRAEIQYVNPLGAARVAKNPPTANIMGRLNARFAGGSAATVASPPPRRATGPAARPPERFTVPRGGSAEADRLVNEARANPPRHGTTRVDPSRPATEPIVAGRHETARQDAMVDRYAGRVREPGDDDDDPPY